MKDGKNMATYCESKRHSLKMPPTICSHRLLCLGRSPSYAESLWEFRVESTALNEPADAVSEGPVESSACFRG